MRKTAALFGLGLLIFALMGMGVPLIKKIQFNIGCGGYLKSAADAPTVELAKPELDVALRYMEDKGLTRGHSHLIIKNRQADVGYWYTRTKEARADLDTITEESTGLEKSNMLMKLRETLLDDGESGTKVTTPPHIPIYPHQWFWSIMCILGGLAGVFAFIFFAVALSD